MQMKMACQFLHVDMPSFLYCCPVNSSNSMNINLFE